MCKLYENGGSSIDWNADDETELGENPTIALVSLGHAREFLFCPIDKVKCSRENSFSFFLGDGALLVMSGSVQDQFFSFCP